MSLLGRTKFSLRTHRILPKKELGQNFLIEPSILQRMVTYASLNSDDTVLDVGAGLGFLTRLAAGKCKAVLAVETDARLASILREQFVDEPKVKIIEGDVLKTEVPKFNKVVSIPPYHISSPLLLWLFKNGFELAVLVFQKEFAKRLTASVGSDDYGWLTVLTYYYAETELLDEIPRQMFYPEPKVGSKIVCLRSKKPRPFTLKNGNQFRLFTQSVFSQRNRKVRNALLPCLRNMLNLSKGSAVKVAEGLPFLDKRARELAPEDFGVLANALFK